MEQNRQELKRKDKEDRFVEQERTIEIGSNFLKKDALRKKEKEKGCG